ncbi:hypothetical protein BJY52DRAFT_1149196 [Lactarius psammicola]|nr:hypothetical protein BJY52DRAFT_1149196 [Lactarius psammicola]
MRCFSSLSNSSPHPTTDYDRVFSCMGIPACLWRWNDEIYKGNREFAELVGIDGYTLRDGRLCVYGLVAEESAVNYCEVRSPVSRGSCSIETRQRRL